MRRRRRRRRRRRFLQEVAHRTRRGCARRRGLVLASASCCSFGRRGHRAWWRGGACWLPLMPFAVFGYFHGGCWRARAQLRQYPLCLFCLDRCAVLDPPRQPQKKDACEGYFVKTRAPGLVAVRVWAPWPRAGARRPPAVGRHLTRGREVQEVPSGTTVPGETRLRIDWDGLRHDATGCVIRLAKSERDRINSIS